MSIFQSGPEKEKKFILRVKPLRKQRGRQQRKAKVTWLRISMSPYISQPPNFQTIEQLSAWEFQ